MEKNMNFQGYLQRTKLVQEYILKYIEKNDDEKTEYNNLQSFLTDQRIGEDRKELKTFLNLIFYIGNHHHRSCNFNDKIRKIILIFKKSINQYLSKKELFNIFKNCKTILFILFTEKLLFFEPDIVSEITSENYKNNFYGYYFYYELKDSLDLELCEKVESFLQKHFETDSKEKIESLFNKNRQIGENDQYICKLIREDSIDEFKKYIKENLLDSSSIVKSSIFETNIFLIKNKPSLIEYSAFFGSIKIFKYLCSCTNELNSSLWMYAIHSQNIEIIHILEDKKVCPPNNDFEECLFESIKCHHINLTNYLLDKYFVNQSVIKEKIVINGIKFFNFELFGNDPKNLSPFINNLCKYDYYNVINFLLINKNIDLNERKISKHIFLILFKFNFLNEVYFAKFSYS